MSIDLGGVVSTLIATGLGSAATLAAAFSPSSRRIKRLERLSEARAGVTSSKAQLRLDYAIDELSYQVAEDSRHLGHRPRGRTIWPAALMLMGGVMLMVLAGLWPQYSPGFTAALGLGLVLVGYTIIMAAVLIMPGDVEQRVERELIDRGDDQRSMSAKPRKSKTKTDEELVQGGDGQRGEPAGEEGLTQGDVPTD